MLRPYVSAYANLGSGDLAGSLAALVVFAPVIALPVAYLFWPSRAGSRHPVSAVAVVAIPLYLAVASVVLKTSVLPILPALTLVAMFGTWLALQQLSQVLRVAAVLLLAASAILSWTATGVWDNPAWKSALVTARKDRAVLAETADRWLERRHRQDVPSRTIVLEHGYHADAVEATCAARSAAAASRALLSTKGLHHPPKSNS
eukprot:gene54957-73417_t